ncbi:MAG: hypothetical protein AB7I19_08405 [Planctomycetota bacterium]
MELRSHDVVFWRDARAAMQRTASELRCGAFAIELQLAAVLREEFRFGDEFLVLLKFRARCRLEPRLDTRRNRGWTLPEYREWFQRELRDAYLSAFEDLVAGDEDAQERDRMRGIIAVREGLRCFSAPVRAVVASDRRGRGVALALSALRGRLDGLLTGLPEISASIRGSIVREAVVAMTDHIHRAVGSGRSDQEMVVEAAQLVLLDEVLRRVQDWYDEHPSIPRSA